MAGAWWRHLTLREKVGSTLGTVRRVVRRRLWRPATVSAGGDPPPEAGGR